MARPRSPVRMVAWVVTTSLAGALAHQPSCGVAAPPSATTRAARPIGPGTARILPDTRSPESNPMTPEKVELGRFLFYDRRLSGNGTQACASCHLQAKAFTDGLPTAVGSTGQAHPRNAQGLANVAYHATLTWASPSLVTLEKQMETPLFGTDPIEMGVNDDNKQDILNRLAADPHYPEYFAQAYPGQRDTITWAHVIQAIAAFQRSLISGNSKYDRYLRGTPAHGLGKRGMNLFFLARKPSAFTATAASISTTRSSTRAAASSDAVPQHRPVQHRRHRRAPSPTGACSS